MILSAQLGALRNAEVQRAIDKLGRLSPEIEQHRKQGCGVVVTLVVEAPESLDLAAIWTVWATWGRGCCSTTCTSPR